jgi:hypothetical protein
MLRKPEEVVRSAARFNTKNIKIAINGARIEIVFDGVEAGIFHGKLQLDIIKNSNLMRLMLVAKKDHPSTSFKYDAGLSGLPLSRLSSMSWRDVSRNPLEDAELSGKAGEMQTIKTANRLIAAEFQKASMAFFPPPHSFYWTRGTEEVLGYKW